MTPETTTRSFLQSFIPGYRVRFIELDNACAYLVSQGWAGGIPFDEAMRVALDPVDAALLERVLHNFGYDVPPDIGKRIAAAYLRATLSRASSQSSET